MSNAAMQSITDICGVEVASATSTPRVKKCKSCHSQGSCMSCRAGQEIADTMNGLRRELKQVKALLERCAPKLAEHAVDEDAVGGYESAASCRELEAEIRACLKGAK